MEYLKTYSSEGAYRTALRNSLPRQSVALVGDSNVKFVDEYDEVDKTIKDLIAEGYSLGQMQQAPNMMYLGRIATDERFDFDGDGSVDPTDSVYITNRKYMFSGLKQETLQYLYYSVLPLTFNGGKRGINISYALSSDFTLEESQITINGEVIQLADYEGQIGAILENDVTLDIIDGILYLYIPQSTTFPVDSMTIKYRD